MVDLPLKKTLAEALVAAGNVHDEYERVVLKGIRDEMWAGFYAAFVLGRLGEFAEASRLAALIEEVEAGDDWGEVAAEHVLIKLRS